MKNLRHAFPALTISINSLNVTTEFKTISKLNGLITLEDLIGDLDFLPTHEHSGIKILKEALTVLEEHGLGKLAED